MRVPTVGFLAIVWGLIAPVLGRAQDSSSSRKALVDTTDSRIAAMTLLVYRATIELDGAGPVTSYSVAPDSTQLTFEQTATRLAALAKPVDCAAHREGSNLTLTCKPIEDTERLRLRAKYVAFTASIRSRILEMSKPSAQSEFIELRAGRDRYVVSLGEYRQWEWDYSLSTPHSLGGEPPPRSYGDRRIGLIMEVVDGSGVHIEVESH
jgi:hypothetical protein